MGTDSLYYIMDYSGHYYRTNQADQLVAVVGDAGRSGIYFCSGKQTYMCR